MPRSVTEVDKKKDLFCHREAMNKGGLVPRSERNDGPVRSLIANIRFAAALPIWSMTGNGRDTRMYREVSTKSRRGRNDER